MNVPIDFFDEYPNFSLKNIYCYTNNDLEFLFESLRIINMNIDKNV